MPRTYDVEFRRRVVDLVRSGRSVAVVAGELGWAEATVYRWKAQGPHRSGRETGPAQRRAWRAGRGASSDSGVGDRAGAGYESGRIVRGGVRPKDKYPVIAELAMLGFSATLCCRLLRVAPSGFFMWRRRAPTPRAIRLAWLTDLVVAVHANSRGTYGWRRVHVELIYGHGIIVNRKTIRKIMRAQTLHGPPGMNERFRSKANLATAADLVQRGFDRPGPNQLWVTGIERHEALSNRVEVGDLYRRAVAAARS